MSLPFVFWFWIRKRMMNQLQTAMIKRFSCQRTAPIAMIGRIAFAALLLLAPSPAEGKRLTKKEYNEKAKEYRKSHSKSDFVEKIEDKMSTARGDRAWKYFQEQLDDGRVSFRKDNVVQFMLPPSHAFSKYTDKAHPAIADAVEFVFRMARAVYFGVIKSLPEAIKDHHDDATSWVFESEYVRYGMYGFLGFFFLNLVFRRFTCGLSAEQKALAELGAKEYAKMKKGN